MLRREAPYGTWVSPITADAATVESLEIRDVLVDVYQNEIYHIERRASEQGRDVLVNSKSGQDVIRKGSGIFDVRTSVHGYGGAAAIVDRGVFYFSNLEDGRVYSVKEGGVPAPVTPDNPAHRFADFTRHPSVPNFLVCLLEDHNGPGPSVFASLVALNTVTGRVTPLVTGAGCASPRFSPGGDLLAWLHFPDPDKPWEGAQLRVAQIVLDHNSSSLVMENSRHVAGKQGEISVSQPYWVSDDVLLFTSDELGYQNPCLYKISTARAQSLMSSVSLDFSNPPWLLGVPRCSVIPSDGKTIKALFSVTKKGRNALYVVSSDQDAYELECPYVEISCLRFVRLEEGIESVEIAFRGKQACEAQAVVHAKIRLGRNDKPDCVFTVLKGDAIPPSPESPLSKDLISIPQHMTLIVPSKEPLHVVFYPPKNPEYDGSSVDGELPPCIVNIHSGLTDMEGQGLAWRKQYFTSRGWAWLDVNYAGSSGFRRKHMHRIVDTWGMADVQGAIHAAGALSAPDSTPQLIDASRTVIRGASAGIYTVIAALSVPADSAVFAAGTVLIGFGDFREQNAAAQQFERVCMSKLIGGTRARSAENITRPLLILQGNGGTTASLDLIVESIKQRGGKAEHRVFEGGKTAETLSLEAEKVFYENVLGLKK